MKCGFLALWTALSFLSFSTAIYNPDFHEKLHVHETHQHYHASHHAHPAQGHCNGRHAGSEQHNSHESDASCDVCNVQSHIATNISPFFQINERNDSLFEPLQMKRASFYLSEVSHSFSGRAPPAGF